MVNWQRATLVVRRQGRWSCFRILETRRLVPVARRKVADDGVCFYISATDGDLRPRISARFLWRTDGCPLRTAEKQHRLPSTTKRMTWTEWTIDSSGHVQLSTFSEKIIVLSSIYEYIPPCTGYNVVCILHGNPASLRLQARKFIFPRGVKRSYFLYRRATWLLPSERVFQLPLDRILCSKGISKIQWDFSFFFFRTFIVLEFSRRFVDFRNSDSGKISTTFFL